MAYSKEPSDVATSIAFLDKVKLIYNESTDVDAIYTAIASINTDFLINEPTLINYRNGTSAGLIDPCISSAGNRIAQLVISGVKSDVLLGLTIKSDVIALKRILNKTYLGEGDVAAYFDEVKKSTDLAAQSVMEEVTKIFPKGTSEFKHNIRPTYKMASVRIKHTKLSKEDLLNLAKPIIEHILEMAAKESMIQPKLSSEACHKLYSYKTGIPFFMGINSSITGVTTKI